VVVQEQLVVQASRLPHAAETAAPQNTKLFLDESLRLLCPCYRLDVAGRMDNLDNLNTVGHWSVQHDVWPNHERADVRPQIIPLFPQEVAVLTEKKMPRTIVQ